MNFHQNNRIRKFAEWSSILGILLCFLSIGFIFLIFLTTSILPYILVAIFVILTLICMVLAILGLKGPRSNLAKTSIAMCILAAGVFAFIAPLALEGSPAREKFGKMERVIETVCQGKAHPTANAFNPGVDVPRILAINPKDNFATANTVPDKYWPANLEEVNLVACLAGEKEEVIQTCDYSNDKTIKRIGYTVDITLVTLKTGEVFKEGKLQGSDPEPCPPVVADDGFTLPMYGGHAGSTELGTWLEKVLVMP